MFNSPIPFRRTNFITGYYVSLKDKDSDSTTKIHRPTYSSLVDYLREIYRDISEFNANIDNNIFIEYFSPSLEYYTTNVNLVLENKVSLEQKYNASIMWKTSANG